MTWLILTLLGATAGVTVSLVFTHRKMDRAFAAYRADTDRRLTDCEGGATRFIPRVHVLVQDGQIHPHVSARRSRVLVETKGAL